MPRLLKCLTPPFFEEDEEKTRAASVLNALQLTLIVVTILAALASLFVFAEKLSSLIVVAGLAIVLATSRVLMYRERVRFASVLVLAGIWVVVTALVAFAGGMNSIDAIYYLSLTVIGGLLLGPGAMVFVAGISVLAGLAMVLSEVLGYPLPQLFPVPAFAGWINFAFGLFLVTITLNIALRSLHDALALSRQRLRDREKAEAALRRSEGRLRAILEAATDVSFVITDGDEVEPRVLEFSPGAERIFGYGREEMLGKSAAVLHIPEDVALFPEITRQMREKKESSRRETYLVRRSGEVFPALFTTYPLFDADGKMHSVLGISIDITARKQVTEALRASEEKFRQIVESSPMGIHLYELDAKDRLIFTGANPAADRILGIDHTRLVGKTIEQAFPPLAQTEIPYHYRRAALEGIPWQTEQIDYEDAGIWGAYQAYVFQTGPRRATAMFLDITARKRAEREREQLLARIQEQARQVQQIMDTVPEGLFLLDAEARVTLANPLGQRDLHTLADAKVGDVLTHLGQQPLAMLLTSPPAGLWHEITLEDRIFQLIARAIETGSVSPGWLFMIRDVTQSRKVEQRAQQQERLVAVGQLAAGIAHDFNNIMATIVLYAQMSARSADVPPRVQERLSIIHQQALHATHLTQQILDFSRRAVFERQPLDMLLLLKEQVSILQRMLPEHIRVTLDSGGDEYFVYGSSTAMQQVFMNLAVNARDAMPDGGELHFGLARIHVERAGRGPLPEMTAGDWIEVKVADTGGGIPPEVMSHLFDPFVTTKEPGKGTGLGLPQVHGIVGMHDGTITVKTQRGYGTTFVMYLPVFLSTASESSTKDENANLEVGHGQTILVVEDNAATRQALVDTLESLDYQVIVAEHGQQALTLLEQRAGEIALVLSDVVMPEMGGIAMLQAMEQRNLTVPVVLLTGHPLKTELENLQASGGASLLADWVLKPADLETLAGVIARALGKLA